MVLTVRKVCNTILIGDATSEINCSQDTMVLFWFWLFISWLAAVLVM